MERSTKNLKRKLETEMVSDEQAEASPSSSSSSSSSVSNKSCKSNKQEVKSDGQDVSPGYHQEHNQQLVHNQEQQAVHNQQLAVQNEEQLAAQNLEQLDVQNEEELAAQNPEQLDIQSPEQVAVQNPEQLDVQNPEQLDVQNLADPQQFQQQPGNVPFRRGRANLPELPEIPLKRVLRLITFQDKKNLRLVNRRLCHEMIRLVPDFRTWSVCAKKDAELPDNPSFENSGTEIILKMDKWQEFEADKTDKIEAWMEKYAHRITVIENLGGDILLRLQENSDIVFSELTRLELSGSSPGAAPLLDRLTGQLETLKLKDMDLQILSGMEKVMTTVTELQVTSCSNSAGLCHLINQAVTSVTVLKIIYFKEEIDFNDLEYNFQQLKELEICYKRHLRMKLTGFWKLLRSCEHTLTSIDLQGASIPSVSRIQEKMKAVKKLRVVGCESNQTLNQLIEKCSDTLEYLVLKWANISHFSQTDYQLPCLNLISVYDNYGNMRLNDLLDKCSDSLEVLHVGTAYVNSDFIIHPDTRLVRLREVYLDTVKMQEVRNLQSLLRSCYNTIKILGLFKVSPHVARCAMPNLVNFQIFPKCSNDMLDGLKSYMHPSVEVFHDKHCGWKWSKQEYYNIDPHSADHISPPVDYEPSMSSFFFFQEASPFL